MWRQLMTFVSYFDTLFFSRKSICIIIRITFREYIYVSVRDEWWRRFVSGFDEFLVAVDDAQTEALRAM